jgi:hypothetical protein
MDALEYFEIAGSRGFFRPSGSVSLAEVVNMVTVAIEFARAHGVRELIVNVCDLTGFESPSITQRYFFVEKWAIVAGASVRLAMVVRTEMINPQKFGVTVAVNRGLDANVFESEAEAVDWLDIGAL